MLNNKKKSHKIDKIYFKHINSDKNRYYILKEIFHKLILFKIIFSYKNTKFPQKS